MARRILTLLSVAGLALIAATASAQTPVFSVNSVGYVKVSCPPGFTMVSNPLNVVSNGTANHSLNAIIPSVPNASFFFKFAGGGFATNPPVFFGGQWIPNIQLLPGEGGFLYVPSQTDVVFSGELRQGVLDTPVPTGYSILASQVPQTTTITQLGFQAAIGDILFRFNPTTQQFDQQSYSFFSGGWAPAEPVINAGESFFLLNLGAPRTWSRNFSVTP
jgi:hypothetical protein